MLNKNDPLIGAVQEVMKRNHAEREAARLVNEKFGVHDRKALPHEQLGAWDDAYKTVLTEGVEALDEKIKMTQQQMANLDGKKEFTANDLRHLRAGTHIKKAAAGELEEAQKMDINAAVNAAVAARITSKMADKAKTPEEREKLLAKMRKYQSQVKMQKEETVEEMVNPTSAPTSQTSASTVRKAAVKQNVRMGGNPTGAASSQTPASTVRKAAVRQNVRMGGNPTGSPVRPSSSKGPMEEDVTSPSGMGIKGPDYAPAGTKPDYAVRKTVGPKSDLIKKPTMSSGNSTVTQTGKTSSSATKSTMKESNLQEEPVSKAQRRFFGLVRGIQKGEAHGSAKAEKAAREMSAKSVRDYANTSEKGLPEKVSEAMNQPQIRGQSNVAGARLSGSFTTQGALPRPPRPAIDSAPRPQVAKNTPTTSAAAKEVAGARLSGSFTTQGALPQKPASAAKTGPSFERTGRGGSPSMAPKPADRPNDLGKAGVPGTGGKLAPAAAPKPTAKPVQAVKKPAAAAPVKNASTRGGTMSQSDANVLAKVRAGGGQKLSKTLPSGRERLKFFAARNAERRGP